MQHFHKNSYVSDYLNYLHPYNRSLQWDYIFEHLQKQFDITIQGFETNPRVISALLLPLMVATGHTMMIPAMLLTLTPNTLVYSTWKPLLVSNRHTTINLALVLILMSTLLRRRRRRLWPRLPIWQSFSMPLCIGITPSLAPVKIFFAGTMLLSMGENC